MSLRRCTDSAIASPPGVPPSSLSRPLLKSSPKTATTSIVLPKLATTSVTTSRRTFSGPNKRAKAVTARPRTATATNPGTETTFGSAKDSGSSPTRASYTAPRRPAGRGLTQIKSAASGRVNGPKASVWAGPLAESFDGLKRWDVTVLGFPGLRGQRQPEVAMDKSKGRMREAAGAFTATRPRRPRAGAAGRPGRHSLWTVTARRHCREAGILRGSDLPALSGGPG